MMLICGSLQTDHILLVQVHLRHVQDENRVEGAGDLDIIYGTQRLSAQFFEGELCDPVRALRYREATTPDLQLPILHHGRVGCDRIENPCNLICVVLSQGVIVDVR